MEKSCLNPLAHLVLLGPARVELLVEGVHLVVLLGEHVVDLDFYFVSSLLHELSCFLLGEIFDGLADSGHFGIAAGQARLDRLKWTLTFSALSEFFGFFPG